MYRYGAASVPNCCRWLKPVVACTCHLAAPAPPGPATPRRVKIWMTPAAASVPYRVAAAAPFTTSMRSMSSGLMSFSGLAFTWPLRRPWPACEETFFGYSSLRSRTPSI